MKKFLKLFIVLIATVFSFKSVVNAATVSEEYLNNTSEFGMILKYFDDDRSQVSLFKISLDGDPAYCVEIGVDLHEGEFKKVNMVDFFKQGISETDAKALSKRISEIIYFGYGYNTGRTTLKYYLATQKLVWEAISASGFNASRFFLDRLDAVDQTVPTFETIDYYSNNLQGKIDITTEVNVIEQAIENYYKTPSFCDSTTQLDLEANGTVTLTDTNSVLSKYTMNCGDGLTCQKSGNKLTVSPGSGTDQTITFSKAKIGDGAYLYEYNDSSKYQHVIAGGEIGPVTASVAFNVAAPNVVRISKQDATTGRELPGAHLVLKDSDGHEVDSWTSTTTPHEVEGLTPGTYSLTETIAPEGYKLSTETVTFTVKADGTVDEPVIMKNSPTSVKISKQDATTGKELPGAHLVLKDSGGNEVDSWTSTSTPHEIKNLAPGTYSLTETIAPKGYILSTETVTFTVKEDGTVEGTLVMKNKPEEVPEVPKTGMVITVISGLIGILCLGYAVNYLVRMKEEN